MSVTAKTSRASPGWQGRALRKVNALVAIGLATTLIITLYAWQFIRDREDHQAEKNLSELAAGTTDALKHRMQIYERALEGAAALVQVNGGISSTEWRQYVDGLELDQNYRGMGGFGLFEQVEDADLPTFEERLRREYGSDFDIHPRVDRDEHFIINRIEPLEDNLAALGLNLAFEEGRRQAIAQSRTSATPTLTRPIILVQDAKQGAGFLLLYPVFDDQQRPTGQWVYAPLVAEELLTGLTPQQGLDFNLEVSFGDDPEQGRFVFATDDGGDPKFDIRETVSLAGQPFHLRWSSLPSFEKQSSSSAASIVLLSGLVTSLLLGILLVMFQRREAHVMREVKRSTSKLAARNRMFELAEATAHIGHWCLELETNRISWSDEVYRLHGLVEGDTPDLSKAIEFYHPDDREIVEQSINTAVEALEPYMFKARLVTADGRLRHVEVRGRVEVDDLGQPSSIIGVIMDRSEETLMRERLTETIEEARSADRAKSSFLANMSHEIRTPMNGVIGFTELALSEEQVPEQRRRLQMIADSSNAMLRLLNDLLDFAKIEAKQMAIVKEAADIRHTLRSCQRLMEPVAKERQLQLHLDIDPEVPASILIDKMRVRQIILNLVGNALKFTEIGEVRVAAKIGRREIDAREILLITVRDTGIGIPEDRVTSVFGEFVQADDTTARRYGGTGLGLPISADLAELMDGTLSVESELGRGSTFILALPFERCATLERPVALDAESVRGCGHSTRMRILVAEDNPVNQELTVAMVQKAGHACSLVGDGRQAVDAILAAKNEGQPYDLVLMDMQMPKMDGLAATREVRKAGIDVKALPILAVTANAYADDITRCLDSGMQAHLAKPLRLRSLCAAIDSWARRPAEQNMPADTQIGNASSAQNDEMEETDPRIRKMFEDRKDEAKNAIDMALEGQSIDKSREAIAGLLHQIAGVAAYFGQQELGEYCRSNQNHLLETKDCDRSMQLLESIRKKLSE